MTGIECGIVKASFTVKIDGTLGVARIRKSLQGYVCSNTLQELLHRDMATPERKSIPLNIFSVEFYSCLCIILLAMIIVMIEIFTNISQRYGKSEKLNQYQLK